jgi:Asp-tRNA(Asn)/Glu-tRNA(Gln) amidotransferase A subunit family amidase
MESEFSAAQDLYNEMWNGRIDPLAVAKESLSRANSNTGRNVYLAQEPAWTLAEATSLQHRFAKEAAKPPLYGIPVSLKDCFDLAGFPTTCGSRFYAERNGIAMQDSWVATRLRRRGAVITGKTHLHQLAYGITGENSDYGDCVQPRNSAWLTGGSSSGAVASVQEGSAMMAIGTDTGGSVRVPASFCGLAGYRASINLGNWTGGSHLAQSFDTIGILFRDLRDGPWLARALFDLPEPEWLPERRANIGVVDPKFLLDCDPSILESFEAFTRSLAPHTVTQVDTTFWEEAFSIFSPIQAHEAATLHSGNFTHFERLIRERLEWGASIPEAEISALRLRHTEFRRQMNTLFEQNDFLILPCAPVGHLLANADHSAARSRILRYTAPASLAGIPVVTVPLPVGGVQVMARQGADSDLLHFAAFLSGRME